MTTKRDLLEQASACMLPEHICKLFKVLLLHSYPLMYNESPAQSVLMLSEQWQLQLLLHYPQMSHDGWDAHGSTSNHGKDKTGGLGILV